MKASVAISILCGLLVVSGCDKQETATSAPTNPPATQAVETPPPATTATNAPAPAVISATEAKNHIGENATVKGKVFRVHESKKGDVFIDIGGKYPDAPFTAVCFKQAIPTAQLKALEGKTISVTGKIKEYQGRVEVILDSVDQISE